MAILTNSHETFDMVGIREDLSDDIYNISPEECPFFQSVATKGKAAASTFVEWELDSLATAAQNKQVQGEDYKSAGLDASVAPTRIGNYTQISEKDATVTGTARAVTTAGRRDELAYHIMKKTKEIKRDIEFSMLGNYAGSPGSSGTAAVSAGVPAWLFTNTVFESGNSGADPDYSGDPYPDATRTDDGTPDAFVEADVQSGMQQAYTSGGNPTVLMTGVYNKTVFSSFDGIAQIRRDAPGMKQAAVVGAADVYISDFGALQVVANRFQRARDAFLFDTEFWETRWLRPMATEPLAKSGDADTQMIIGEWVLVCKNEAASAGIYDLTTS